MVDTSHMAKLICCDCGKSRKAVETTPGFLSALCEPCLELRKKTGRTKGDEEPNPDLAAPTSEGRKRVRSREPKK
jgi:hypothetical protein